MLARIKMYKDITCIICPISCRIKVSFTDDTLSNIEGYQCKKGKTYAMNEATCPRRIFTSTIRANDGELSRVPVRSTKPIKRENLFKAMEIAKNVKLHAPVGFGQIIIKDFTEKGIDLISTWEVKGVHGE
jgi:CxxC motif-containing protein